ncbi:MAG: helix-turn-helix transcriptional regulator [Corallococcus sp.]|nr:helix-turn-helix transcriptional regulator [Corallococcus sp.]MCM1359029.1 helix-turn-helix transcriptional regulator [Corallococcus sp.]MCM1395018.1 helix-turn-helix transcriptional regulator [Corallococcus sp.]
MKITEAVAIRLNEIMKEFDITQYRLSAKSGVAQSTIHDLRNCKSKSINLVAIYEIMDGLELDIEYFFNSPLFKRENLE